MTTTWIDLARGARAADVLLANVAPTLTRKDEGADPLTRDGFDRVIRDVALRLLDVVEEPEATVARALRDALDVNWPALSPTAREKALRQAEGLLGRLASEVAPPLRAVLREEGRRIVAATKGAAIGRYELPIAAAFGKQDVRIVEHAAGSQALFVRDNYGKRAARLSEQARKIGAAGLEEGLDRYAIGEALQSAIGAQLGRSASYYPMVASVFTARARSWGVLASFEEAGIETWRVSAVLDEVTCFAPGTRVLLGDGTTYAAIETIRPGDVVMSCRGRPRKVRAVVQQPTRKWGELVLDTREAGPLVLTQNHGVLTARGWMRAGVLAPHDRVALWSASGNDATSLLWGNERDWGMRRGRHDARTLDVDPFPHSLIDRFGRFASVRSNVWSATGCSEAAHDLDVEEDAGYIAENVIVHNSHICRYLDGKVFSTARAIQRFRDVADHEDPEAVRLIQPFVRERGGLLFVGPPEGEDHFPIAQVDESAMGKAGERGRFSQGAEPAALEAHGIGAPPYHGRCRTDLGPA